MQLDEAKQILKRAGYLLEFRDSSNPLDKETEESNWKSDRTSWNNVKVNYKTNIKGEDTTKKANAVAKMTNELISKVDEVCNKFEDYDYFVKRYDSNKIQIRTTEQADTGVPFIQISVNEKDGEYTFCCGLGRVEQELRRKTYKEYNSTEDVLKWVSACLGNGYINESLEEAKQILNDNGYIVEDTDTHDDEEFAFDMKKRNIFKSAKNRALTDEEDKEIDSIDRKLNKIPGRDSVWQKKLNAGIWAIKLTVSSDAYDEEKDEYVDDYTLGYLKPDGTVSKTYGNDCMLNYRQCQDLIDKYARYKDGPAKPGFEKVLKQKFKIKDKQATIFLSPGTIKHGKFHLFNIDDGLYDEEEV